MADGGNIARRSARAFANEYQRSCSRDSSHSSPSPVNFGLDMRSGVAIERSAGELQKWLGRAKTLKGNVSSRPVNFGVVIPGFYRSGYPKTEDHEYLKSLGLKTIVTLVQREYPEGYEAFMELNGINHILIDIQSTKKVAIPDAVINSIMRIVLDRRNYPILVHCNHGKHRTGCVVGVIRKVMGWRFESIIKEYTTYAWPKTRESDIGFIQRFDVSSLSQVFREPTPEPPCSRVFSSVRMKNVILSVTLALSLCIIAAMQLWWWSILI